MDAICRYFEVVPQISAGDAFARHCLLEKGTLSAKTILALADAGRSDARQPPAALAASREKAKTLLGGKPGYDDIQNRFRMEPTQGASKWP